MQYYFEPLEIPGQALPKKYQNQFEYLFFFIEPSDALCSQSEYSEKYKSHLKKFFNLDLKLNDYSLKEKNYWFFENQKVLLDKIKIYKMIYGCDLWDHEIFIANADTDLKEGHYLLKSPLGFSGRGIRNQAEAGSINYPVLVEEKLDRIKDFSYFKESGQFYYYENIIGKKYNYSGSIFSKKNLNNFEGWFKSEGITDKEILLFKERMSRLDQKLEREGFERYNVDCFLYKTSGGVKIHTACEVNLRKTMGYLLSKIYLNYFEKHDQISFQLSKSKPDSQLSSLGPLEGQEFHITYNFD